MVLLKVGIIIFFIAVGIFLIRPSNWTNPQTGGFAPNGVAGISAAAAIIFRAECEPARAAARRPA